MDFTKVTDQVSKIKVKNVVDMLLYFALLFAGLTMISNTFCKSEWVSMLFGIITGCLGALAIIAYMYFAYTNPDYLRSEEYNLRKQSIELMGDKENMLNPNLKNIPLITSPYSKKTESTKTKLGGVK